MTAAASAPDSPRIGQIDALRAIAALLVLVTHATEVFKPAADAAARNVWLHDIAHVMDFGRIGVVVFFMISGYVVANTLSNPATTVPRFVLRRLFRLYPLYWVSVAAACLWMVPGPIDPPTLAANLTMLPTLFGKEPYMGLYWTLETELAFYLIALVLLGVRLLRNPMALLVLACALIACFAAFMFGVVPAPANLSWKSFPLNLTFMLVGILAFIGNRRMLAAAVVVALAPSAFALLRFFASGSPDDLRWGLAYPSAVLVFLAICNSRRMPVEPLATLGLVSYSMYLLHPFALMLVSGVLVPANVLVEKLGMTGAVGVAVVATILVAAFTYRVVERPLNAYARRVTARSRPLATKG
ncbi:MAG TPA: acyltransferase [Usitatibacter sp.]|nr:acyltransferase [Usitatibacter sp.]